MHTRCIYSHLCSISGYFDLVANVCVMQSLAKRHFIWTIFSDQNRMTNGHQHHVFQAQFVRNQPASFSAPRNSPFSFGDLLKSAWKAEGLLRAEHLLVTAWYLGLSCGVWKSGSSSHLWHFKKEPGTWCFQLDVDPYFQPIQMLRIWYTPKKCDRYMGPENGLGDV